MLSAGLPQLEVLWSDSRALTRSSHALGDAYGGDLVFPEPPPRRPVVVANFVSTLDGVVSYATPEGAGGGEISGFFAPDRFVMGLLRAHADAVLVGAGTVRAARSERWTPEDVYPAATEQFATLRKARSQAPQPMTVVMTRSGRLDLRHPGLSDPAVPVLLAASGAAPRVRQPNIHSVQAPGIGGLLGRLRRHGVRLLLCEGGPHLLGELVAANAVDELFLTVAPQIAGRSPDRQRLALVEGQAFSSADAPWWQLLSLHRAGSHLFLRYRINASMED